jgi:hypothetical protein
MGTGTRRCDAIAQYMYDEMGLYLVEVDKSALIYIIAYYNVGYIPYSFNKRDCAFINLIRRLSLATK